MRYLVGFVLALAFVTSSVGVSAQEIEESASPELSVEEPTPEESALQLQQIEAGSGSRPTPKPWLELELDSYGLKMKPTGPTIGGPDYILVAAPPGEMELRVKRAGVGLGVSGGVLGAGILFFGLSYAFSYGFCTEECEHPATATPGLFYTGLIMMAGGAAGVIISGALLGVRKRQPRDAHHATPRRVQWDLARSRLVF